MKCAQLAAVLERREAVLSRDNSLSSDGDRTVANTGAIIALKELIAALREVEAGETPAPYPIASFELPSA